MRTVTGRRITEVGLDEVAIASIAARYAGRGLCLVEGRPATAASLAATTSTWAKRLRAGQTGRDVWRLELRRMNPA